MDLTQLSPAAETIANAYMLEVIFGIVLTIIFMVFIFRNFKGWF